MCVLSDCGRPPALTYRLCMRPPPGGRDVGLGRTSCRHGQPAGAAVLLCSSVLWEQRAAGRWCHVCLWASASSDVLDLCKQSVAEVANLQHKGVLFLEGLLAVYQTRFQERTSILLWEICLHLSSCNPQRCREDSAQRCCG